MKPIYYESHITIEPVSEEDREKIQTLVSIFGFKLAKLLMQKRNEDTPERSKYDTFCTGHGSDQSDISWRMVACVRILQLGGFKVWRYKIEEVTVDSRHKDVLNLLTEEVSA